MFEGLEYDYEELDVREKVEELERLKELYMTEALEELLAIGDQELMENAIDTSENTEQLQKWREKLLEDDVDETPDAKELVLKK